MLKRRQNTVGAFSVIVKPSRTFVWGSTNDIDALKVALPDGAVPSGLVPDELVLLRVEVDNATIFAPQTPRHRHTWVGPEVLLYLIILS